MKKILSTLLVFCAAATVLPAQNFELPKQPASSVAVKGDASKGLRPDQIYLAAVIREFVKDKKTVTLSELENGIINYADKTCKIPRADITTDKPNPADELKTDNTPMKVLQIKCSDPEQAAELFAAMDSLGIDRMNVRHIASSKKDAAEKEVKTEAVKDAHEKATLMLAATGDKPGAVYTITEMNENRFEQRFGESYGGYTYGKKANYGGRRMNINSSVSGDDNGEVRNIINSIRNYSINVSAQVAVIFLIGK